MSRNQILTVNIPSGDNAYIVTCVEPSKKWGRSDDGTSLVLVLGIIRINKVETDLLITLNSPVSKAQFGDDIAKLENGSLQVDSLLNKKIALGESVIREMLNKLVIKEWGLFAWASANSNIYREPAEYIFLRIVVIMVRSLYKMVVRFEGDLFL